MTSLGILLLDFSMRKAGETIYGTSKRPEHRGFGVFGGIPSAAHTSLAAVPIPCTFFNYAVGDEIAAKYGGAHEFWSVHSGAGAHNGLGLSSRWVRARSVEHRLVYPWHLLSRGREIGTSGVMHSALFGTDFCGGHRPFRQRYNITFCYLMKSDLNPTTNTQLTTRGVVSLTK